MMKVCWQWIQDNMDWLFSGVGVTVLVAVGGLLKRYICKRRDKEQKNSDKIQREHIQGNKNVVGNDNISGNGNIVGDSNLRGDGNIVGDGNINVNTLNIYESGYTETMNSKTESWFAKRFLIMMQLLNDAREWNEKEYTVEYISSVIGLKNVGQLKHYLETNDEPDDAFKERFVEVFGVNKEWMVYNRGEFPFASNIKSFGEWPMDILRNEDLKKVKKFIVVIGEYEGLRYALIVRHTTEFCYEIYPQRYILNSNVGNSGVHKLTSFYRFLRETDRINKLYQMVYAATEQEFMDLYRGNIAPMKVKTFKVQRNFIDSFLDLSLNSLERNAKFWDKDLVEVQKIISEDITIVDEINQKLDREKIEKKLYEEL